MEHVFRYPAPEPVAPGAEITLDDESSHHLSRVVRRRAGDGVELVDPGGEIWPSEVVDPGPPSRVRAAQAPRAAAPRPPIVLLVGLAEASRLDLIAEKACELGVRRVAIFDSERAGRRPTDASWAKRRDRLGRVARAAALQSGWGVPPEIDGVLAFSDVLAAPAPGHGYLLDPEADTALDAALSRPLPDGAEVCLVIGPPAGFSRAEVEAATAAGMSVARLGAGLLRTETAAVSAMAVAVSALERGGGGS